MQCTCHMICSLLSDTQCTCHHSTWCAMHLPPEYLMLSDLSTTVHDVQCTCHHSTWCAMHLPPEYLMLSDLSTTVHDVQCKCHHDTWCAVHLPPQFLMCSACICHHNSWCAVHLIATTLPDAHVIWRQLSHNTPGTRDVVLPDDRDNLWRVVNHLKII